ncbi:hypothetical protein BGZ76_002219 [Entomortierella beljakovae]|nr:hypothetical protein BGZ76_002219 [Entomortierella beljakovae]
MAYPTHYKLRMLVLFLALIAELIMIVLFALIGGLEADGSRVNTHRILLIIRNSLILLVYAYSVKGKPIVSKGLRAILVASLGMWVFQPSIEEFLVLAALSGHRGSNYFECLGSACRLDMSYMFFNIFLGLSSIVEAYLTLTEDSNYSIKPHANLAQPVNNVVLVSPDQQYGQYNMATNMVPILGQMNQQQQFQHQQPYQAQQQFQVQQAFSPVPQVPQPFAPSSQEQQQPFVQQQTVSQSPNAQTISP